MMICSTVQTVEPKINLSNLKRGVGQSRLVLTYQQFLTYLIQHTAHAVYRAFLRCLVFITSFYAFVIRCFLNWQRGIFHMVARMVSANVKIVAIFFSNEVQESRNITPNVKSLNHVWLYGPRVHLSLCLQMASLNLRKLVWGCLTRMLFSKTTMYTKNYSSAVHLLLPTPGATLLLAPQ